MERGQIAAIAQPGTQRIICEAGALWLTQDGRGKDIVLESGQEFQCEQHDRNARLLAYALTDARGTWVEGITNAQKADWGLPTMKTFQRQQARLAVLDLVLAV